MKPVLLVVSPYYAAISQALVAGATAAIEQAGAMFEHVTVPGCLEIPAAIAIARHSGRYEAYVALGCVIRGETTHYETVANESARGLQELGTAHGAAIGNGILTCETLEQAQWRADPAQGNKGGEAAGAALALAALRRALASDPA